MKYILGAVALALAAPSFAQSSVTLYGVVDLAGEYVKGAGGKKVSVTSAGGLAGSRIGFKGTEDIGGGNFVDFVLEGGLNVDTGTSAQGGALFGRQAFGDLRLADVGTFSAGRQYSSLYIQSGEFSAFSNVTGSSASTAVIGGYAGGYEPIQGGSGTATTQTNATGESLNGGPARVNNSFRYTTPVFSGLKASVLYGAGEVTGMTTKDRLVDGSVRYTNFGLDAMVSVVSDKFHNNTDANSTDVRTITATASYAIDTAHIYAGYLKGDDRRDIATKQNGRGIWVGADYRMGASLLKAQWLNNRIDNFSATGDAKANVYGLGYQYDLSKRSAVYTSLSRFVNTGYTAANTGRYTSSLSGTNLTTIDNHSLTEFALGVRHSF